MKITNRTEHKIVLNSSKELENKIEHVDIHEVISERQKVDAHTIFVGVEGKAVLGENVTDSKTQNVKATITLVDDKITISIGDVSILIGNWLDDLKLNVDVRDYRTQNDS